MNNYLFVLTLIILFMCSCNPCKDVICLNDGVCNDGTCDCPDAFKGPDCSIHKNPYFVKFLDIDVFNIPSLNPDGETWDEDGSAADIAVVMISKIGNLESRYQLGQEEENATGSAVNLANPTTITNFEYITHRTIGVYDKEEFGEESYEPICIFDWNIDSVAQATEYSPFLIFSELGCPEIRLQVQYDYVN